ncbi:chorismate-binding protein [Flavobacteriaceae bacterium]|nr:chorismate-binding protein [Flavobacteriaceae bacterium]MDC1491951.1 chorismate-binding protein [Flavobacteriaceae bacterium]
MNQSDLFEIIINHKDKNLPFVVFNEPYSDTINAKLQNDNKLHTECDLSKGAYIFAPFDAKKFKKIYIPFDKCKSYKSIYLDKVSKSNFKNKELDNSLNENIHTKLIEKSLNVMKEGFLKKVVLSRIEFMSISSLDLISVFNKLLSFYNNSYVYVWFHPKVGFWIGATPEKLLIINDKLMETDALAGTTKSNSEGLVIWSKKEIDEQEYVKSYISDSLVNIVDNLSLTETVNVKSGDLYHLCTTITAKLKSFNDYNSVVDLIHPTPAVCGIPLDISKEFINLNEDYDRSYYTGYLGVISPKNKSVKLYVNLRCAEVFNNSIKIYVGGGITKDSNPLLEYEETIAKSSIMKNVFY